jgi:hypothetical protein
VVKYLKNVDELAFVSNVYLLYVENIITVRLMSTIFESIKPAE